MFQQTFVSDSHSARKPLGVLFSLSLQVLALASLILVQLLYIPAIPSVQLRAWLTAPPPVAQPKTVAPAVSPRNPIASKRVFIFQEPVAAPRQINPPLDYETPALSDAGVIGTSANTTPGNDVLMAIGSDVAPPPRPHSKSTAHPSTQRVGGSVMAANIIHQVQPIYPAMARSARVEGTVEYNAVIDKTGRVVNLQLQHGHPLLVKAAGDAILQWRYKPTMLNGNPVDVLTTITVNFKLSTN